MRNYILCALVFCCLCVCCGQSGEAEYGQITDTIYVPRYAQGFEILRSTKGVVLKNINQQNGQTSYTLITDQDPEQSTTLTTICSKIDRVAVMSSSYIAFLAALDCTESICGVSGTQYVSNPRIIEKVESNQISDIGIEGAINYEVLAALKPDVLLSYGLDNTMADMKLAEMGVCGVPICDYLEFSALGRAEWIVIIGEIMGKRDVAIDVFNAIEARYNALVDMTQGCEKPKVMFNIPWRDIWYIPSPDNYTVRLINDAGGEYICDNQQNMGQWGDGLSKAISSEQGFVWAQKADVWLNTNAIKTSKELLAENIIFAQTSPFKNGRIYNNNLRTTAMGGSDFWESGVIMPDVILSDLIAILHPELLADHKLYFYRKIE